MHGNLPIELRYTPNCLRGTQLEELLASLGFLLDRNDLAMKYVLCVVFDKSGQMAVGIIKQKGPLRLIGKITYPGGRVELGEQLEFACYREFLEEVGLVVPMSAWRFVANSHEVAVFAAQVDSISEARTMEDEPVFQFRVDGQLAAFKKHAEMFADDFEGITQVARFVVGFQPTSKLLRLAKVFKENFCRVTKRVKEDRTSAGRRYVRETLEAAFDKEAAIELMTAQASNSLEFEPFDDFDHGMLDELRQYRFQPQVASA